MKTKLTSMLVLVAASMFAMIGCPASGKEKQTILEEYRAAYNHWLDNPAFENEEVTDIPIVEAPNCLIRGLVDVKSNDRITPAPNFMLDGGEGFLLVSQDCYYYQFVNPVTLQPVSRFYSGAGPFEEGLALVRNGDLYGCINTSGKEVIPLNYSEIMPFNEGLARVCEDKYGFVDKEGKAVVPMIYSAAGDSFIDGLAPVRKNGKWGFIDKTGKVVIPFKYDWATNFTDGLACVCLKGQSFYIDKTGSPALVPDYDMVFPFLANEAIVLSEDEGYGVIDSKGNEIVPCGYEWIEPTGYGSYWVSINDKYGIINPSKKIYGSCKYDDWFDFSEDVAFVSAEDNKLEAINPSGMRIMAETFEDSGAFSEGLASVKKNGKWGYIDHAGNVVIPYQFEEAFDFDNGFAVVKMKGKQGVINRTGEIVVPCSYNVIEGIVNGYLIICDCDY